MVLVLGTITLCASAGVGAVNMITEEPIRQAKEQAVKDALCQVLPKFETVEDSVATVDGLEVKVHAASNEAGLVGYAVETQTNLGFGGTVRLMVGFDPEGTLLNINVLEQNETPGLGSRMTEEGNPLLKSFVGRCPGEMNLKVKKDGGDVDALTAATISSRAYTDAVARAYNALLDRLNKDVQASTGATMTR